MHTPTSRYQAISPITVGSRLVGPSQPVFLIAEAGVNHNGDVSLAGKLIDQAVECGANCVKFQTYKTERIVTQSSPKARYQLSTTDPDESQMAMLKKLELPLADYRQLVDRCHEKGILFLSTPYNEEDADFLDDLGVSAFKVASGQAIEPRFLQHLAQKGKPILLSTGMCTLAEIDEAVRVIRREGNEQIIVLQCTTNYPCVLSDCNLRTMQTMVDAFKVVTGYSDHTQGVIASLAAVALGAHVIEKHFTLDKNLVGPDHSSSADPAEFKKLAREIRAVEQCLGSPLKQPTILEKQNALGMRRSLVAKKKIRKEETLSWDNLAMKRPGTGLLGSQALLVMGKTARRNIAPDTLITLEMLK